MSSDPIVLQFNVAYRKDEGDGRLHTPTIGRAFQYESGRVSVRFDSLPITQYWRDGELILFPLKGGDRAR